MPTSTNPLFWEGVLFTSANVALIVLTIWGLYLSPLQREVTRIKPPSPRLAGWLAGLLGLAAFQMVAGAFWDASLHVRTGEIPAGADFLWPPHLMIYSAFLLSLIVALLAVGYLAVPAWRAGERDPRRWFRLNPYLGAVVIASLYSLLSIPGDALWHALYGVDLTAWSPPHLILGMMTCVVQVCAIGLLLHARTGSGRFATIDRAAIVLLGLMLNFAYILAVLEWEMPGGRSVWVNARPLWSYPVVGGCAAFFTLFLAQRITTYRWAATRTAFVFYGVRLGLTLGLQWTGNVEPYFPLWFILGAILMDVVPWAAALAPVWQAILTGGLFAVGYVVLAVPALSARSDLPMFTGQDLVITLGLTWLSSIMLWPVGQAVGRLLRD